jgi:hypothetical protein
LYYVGEIHTIDFTFFLFFANKMGVLNEKRCKKIIVIYIMLQLFSLLSFLCLALCNGQQNLNFTASSITRDQIMSRAQVWVDQKVPYSQSQTKDGYRQDCSGYVSYCWASSTSGGGHVTSNMQEICTKISKSDMKKGDAILLPSTHVILFGGWIDSDAFYEYAEHQSGDVCRKSTGSYNYFATNGYFPCRYNLVSN